MECVFIKARYTMVDMEPIEADDGSRANETTRKKTVACMWEDLRSHWLLCGT